MSHLDAYKMLRVIRPFRRQTASLILHRGYFDHIILTLRLTIYTISAQWAVPWIFRLCPAVVMSLHIHLPIVARPSESKLCLFSALVRVFGVLGFTGVVCVLLQTRFLFQNLHGHGKSDELSVMSIRLTMFRVGLRTVLSFIIAFLFVLVVRNTRRGLGEARAGAIPVIFAVTRIPPVLIIAMSAVVWSLEGRMKRHDSGELARGSFLKLWM